MEDHATFKGANGGQPFGFGTRGLGFFPSASIGG
jgi:hypothetical protein